MNIVRIFYPFVLAVLIVGCESASLTNTTPPEKLYELEKPSIIPRLNGTVFISQVFKNNSDQNVCLLWSHLPPAPPVRFLRVKDNSILETDYRRDGLRRYPVDPEDRILITIKSGQSFTFERDFIYSEYHALRFPDGNYAGEPSRKDEYVVESALSIRDCSDPDNIEKKISVKVTGVSKRFTFF